MSPSSSPVDGLVADLVADLVARLTTAGETVACAESLTAGLVAATIADVPGASVVLRGGVVAYAADLKVALLGVAPELLDERGTVDPAVAAAMAEGVRERLGATWGLATTGVAGPGPSEGKRAGTAHVAVAGPSGTRTEDLRLTGSRSVVRASTVAAVLSLALAQTRREHQTPAVPTVVGGTVGATAPRRARDGS